MNPEEKEALKQEIINEIEERFKGVVIREDVQGILSEVRDKWFRDSPSDNRYTGSIMFDAFGAVTYWKVWEMIRKLVCLICGVGYVRQLGAVENRKLVLEITEILCQTCYDLRQLFIARKNELTGGGDEHDD